MTIDLPSRTNAAKQKCQSEGPGLAFPNVKNDAGASTTQHGSFFFSVKTSPALASARDEFAVAVHVHAIFAHLDFFRGMPGLSALNFPSLESNAILLREFSVVRPNPMLHCAAFRWTGRDRLWPIRFAILICPFWTILVLQANFAKPYDLQATVSASQSKCVPVDDAQALHELDLCSPARAHYGCIWPHSTASPWELCLRPFSTELFSSPQLCVGKTESVPALQESTGSLSRSPMPLRRASADQVVRFVVPLRQRAPLDHFHGPPSD